MSPRSNLLRTEVFRSGTAGAKLRRIGDNVFEGPDPRDFPISSSVPSLPGPMRDEMLDLYAFLFCQGGFRHLGMTFEQFLLVVAFVAPGELSAS
jgi:hypothetical protein